METSGLPPLNAMRAFEAAARHLSFTRAAEELGMTQAAVSYQIKVLEERVGTPLFLRRPRQIVLSEVGQSLAPMVTEAFDLLRGAFAASRENAEATLSISVVPTFAAHWLVQHLGAFQLSHPHLAVRIDGSTALADFSGEEIDIGIRSGRGMPAGLAAHLLLRSDFTPMLSPKLAETIGGVRTPEDLLRLHIIDAGDSWWTHWFDAAGVKTPKLHEKPRSRLGAQTFEAGAAIAGQGVAILTPAFYQRELADGRLVQPFDLVCYDGWGYWLVYPEARRNTPKIRAFRDWILKETAHLRAAHGTDPA